jgi:hypothetical protein
MAFVLRKEGVEDMFIRLVGRDVRGMGPVVCGAIIDIGGGFYES